MARVRDRISYDSLETVELRDVEVFSAGGPYFGQGSPPEGDFITQADIERIARNTNEVVDQLGIFKSPNKIGHSDEQGLLRNTFEVTDGEMPAVGWLHNFRAAMGDDGMWKVVCDISDVPRKFAEMLKRRLWRTRSCELGTVEATDGSGRAWPDCVVGLAWLGGKLPAVNSLDDIYALFMDRRYAEGDVIWDPDVGMEAIRQAVQQAINPNPPDMADGESYEPRYWVMDVAPGKALVQDWSTGRTYVAALDADNKPDSPTDWTPAVQAWVEASTDSATAYESIRAVALKDRGSDVDSSRQMDTDTNTQLSDEQIEQVATVLGIEEDDAAKRREAVASRFSLGETNPPPTDTGDDNPTPPPPPPSDKDDDDAEDRRMSALEARLEVAESKAAKGDEVARKLDKQERDTTIRQFVNDARVAPSKVEFWETKWAELGAEATIELMNELPVREELKGVRGYDSDGVTEDGADDEAVRQYFMATGVPIKEAARA